MQPPVATVLGAGRPTLSFEFFPPKTPAGEEVFSRTLRDVLELGPDFVSLTFGAGGGRTQRLEASLRVLRHIRATCDVKVVAHLTCVGLSRDDLLEAVQAFGDLGISTVLALRGDPPAGEPFSVHPGGLAHADELVRLITELGPYEVGVAAMPYGHPEVPDADTDARVLAGKQAAGAQFAITQMFFDAGAYAGLLQRARAAGATLPVLAGLMPPTRLGQVAKLEGFAGAPLPKELAGRLESCADDQEVAKAGVEWMVQLGRDLLDMGAPGLHLYTLNRSTATCEIAERLGLGNR